MVRNLTNADFNSILKVVNNAAVAYKGIIPNDCWKEPYMPAQELQEEIDGGVQFYGWIENDNLIGVMGIQPVNDVTLIRHAYVLTNSQCKGIGEKLLKHLLKLVKTTKVYVGTWEAADWAISFYKKHGFEMVSKEEKDKLLRKYWNISERQIETSVVLQLKRQNQ